MKQITVHSHPLLLRGHNLVLDPRPVTDTELKEEALFFLVSFLQNLIKKNHLDLISLSMDGS